MKHRSQAGKVVMDSSPIRSIITYVYKQDENHEKLKIYKTKKDNTYVTSNYNYI